VTVKATVTELEKIEQATFGTSMDLYESDQYKVIASTPQQVVLNQEIYVEVNKSVDDANLKMNVYNCWVTDTPSNTGYRYKYPLIEKDRPYIGDYIGSSKRFQISFQILRFRPTIESNISALYTLYL